MNFTKMHGLGNDFVIVSGEERPPENTPDLARRICDRHFGVGADGLVFILPSESGDFAMRIINADGSEAEQCGNAVRCVSKFFYERMSRARRELRVETGAGLQRVWLEPDGEKVRRVRVDMGRPVLEGKAVPTTIDAESVVAYPVEVGERTFSFTAVSMGNPHAVIPVEDAIAFPVEFWGPKLEVHPLFPHQTNVEFVSFRSRSELDMRVWERGVGRTMACGSGACASAVASALTGRTDRRVTVHLQGGDLEIDWNEKDDRVYMTGPAETVFEGKW
ncbi:diaminopimelate epimerase [Paludifilum halophilum]|uniref:Diaminopimelate epimerase n=1 Tax=Paludifilum halophilum TaxID=1642702 RepID=A0A235B332_9BACL|nr:diaminopimelate epimerase [Paludifilum halophilum]OYD06651.1 diaminopimelate epimerase [Paludifilum halophilum]